MIQEFYPSFALGPFIADIRDFACLKGKCMFIGVYNLPGLITFTGLGLGLASCFFALHQLPELSLVCLMYAGVADLFDGFVARRMNLSANERAFGVQIDSLTDAVNFGIAPALIAFQNGLDSMPGGVIVGLYVFAALMRLAHFNVTGTVESKGAGYYQGLPVTYAALILPVAFACRPILEPAVFSFSLHVLLPLLSLCFLLHIPVPKPGGLFYFIFPVLAVGMTWLFLAQ